MAMRLRKFDVHLRWVKAHVVAEKKAESEIAFDEAVVRYPDVPLGFVLGNVFDDLVADRAAVEFQLERGEALTFLADRKFVKQIRLRAVAVLASLPQRKLAKKKLAEQIVLDNGVVAPKRCGGLVVASKHVLFGRAAAVCCENCG